MSDSNANLKIAFIHPDLGIGGAERLVVDAAVGCQSKGHEVMMYTSHHDREHCFEETRDGTLSVRVVGDFLPRTVFGKFYIICAMVRQLILTLWVVWNEKDSYDIFFVDQLSICVPLLKWFTPSRVLFYCHFPDKMLSKRDSKLKRLYRVPIDRLEEWTTGTADTITVNSQFTLNIFRRSFPSILKKPRVLYPPINFSLYNRTVDVTDPTVLALESQRKTFVSINRFERKKNIELALRAFAALRKRVSQSEFEQCRLVVAGGYDRRVTENVEYLEALDSMAKDRLGLTTSVLLPHATEKPAETAQVVFVCSFNDAQRTYLLSTSIALLYTPSNEHFGIVPVESMYACLPVIATNSGGPLESVVDQKTGLLLAPEPELWAQGMCDMLESRYSVKDMGKAGHARVKHKFSLDAFADQLQDILEELASGGRPTHYRYDSLEYIMRIIMAIVIFIVWYYYYW
ncbi:alpha-1,3/1,6-mannosyltransferase ALG2 [Sporodiniella umbellata]|nr:alpha-1,3/1,6-mannosyltransferase ALG2 [Sporodiniella umbellata]